MPHIPKGRLQRVLEECSPYWDGYHRHHLIDEFSTLIRPAVDGVAGAPSIVDYDRADGERPGSGQALRLMGCETLEGGMVWLRHAVEDVPAGRVVSQYRKPR